MASSLDSIYIEDGKIKGDEDDLADALVYMCWCVKEKGLKIFLY